MQSTRPSLMRENKPPVDTEGLSQERGWVLDAADVHGARTLSLALGPGPGPSPPSPEPSLPQSDVVWVRVHPSFWILCSRSSFKRTITALPWASSLPLWLQSR